MNRMKNDHSFFMGDNYESNLPCRDYWSGSVLFYIWLNLLQYISAILEIS